MHTDKKRSVCILSDTHSFTQPDSMEVAYCCETTSAAPGCRNHHMYGFKTHTAQLCCPTIGELLCSTYSHCMRKPGKLPPLFRKHIHHLVAARRPAVVPLRLLQRHCTKNSPQQHTPLAGDRRQACSEVWYAGGFPPWRRLRMCPAHHPCCPHDQRAQLQIQRATHPAPTHNILANILRHSYSLACRPQRPHKVHGCMHRGMSGLTLALLLFSPWPQKYIPGPAYRRPGPLCVVPDTCMSVALLGQAAASQLHRESLCSNINGSQAHSTHRIRVCECLVPSKCTRCSSMDGRRHAHHQPASRHVNCTSPSCLHPAVYIHRRYAAMWTASRQSSHYESRVQQNTPVRSNRSHTQTQDTPSQGHTATLTAKGQRPHCGGRQQCGCSAGTQTPSRHSAVT